MMRLILTSSILLLFVVLGSAQVSNGVLTYKYGQYKIPAKIAVTEKISGTTDNTFAVVCSWADNITAMSAINKPTCDYQYLSKLDHNTFMIRATKNCLELLAADKNVKELFFVPGELKIEPRLLDKSLKGTVRARVSCYSGFTLPSILQHRLVTLKLRDHFTAERSYFDVHVDHNALILLSEEQSVEYISFAPETFIPINDKKRSFEGIQGVNASAGAGGLGLNGAGVTIGHGDNGSFNHIDLNDRVINFSIYTGGNHSAHTAGTEAGAGLLDPRRRGLASDATVLNDDFFDIITEASSYYLGNNMHVTNNSYATLDAVPNCTQVGDYNIYSQESDNSTITYPDLLHVFAAGNYGTTSCPPNGDYNNLPDGPQCAKNTIAIGALISGEGNAPANYTSKGPTDDNRLKPEISTIGTATSCINGNAYSGSSGTSMAAPSVTAAVALMQEAYTGIHGGTFPPAALIKAILCNTSDELGAEGPDFTTGYGKLNINNAVRHTLNGNHVLDAISQGSTQDVAITIPSGTAKLAVTLAWTDPAGNPLILSQLVNDLDLEVIGPSGTTLPWFIAGIGQPVQRAVDNLNNLEQVTILNPVSGNYTLRVKGTSVVGSQQYALTYRTITPDINIQAPFGEEKYQAGESVYIQWDCPVDPSGSFLLEISTDGGATWSTITNKAATARNHNFSMPNVNTRQAQVRISATGLTTDVSSDFTVSGVPAGLAATIPCQGYANLTWNAVPNATGYKIYKKVGSIMVFVDNASTNSYQLSGLTPNVQELIGVTATFPGDIESRRSGGIFVNAVGGACPWSNDMEMVSLLTPVSGRKYTSGELTSSQVITIRLKNLGSSTASGFQVYYKVNGGSEIIENYTGSIATNTTADYTFTTTANLAANGNYSIEAGIWGAPDAPLIANNILSTLVKHVANDPVTLTQDLNTTYKVDFESATSATYSQSYFAMDGIPMFDFVAHSNDSRARTYITSGLARSGTKALSLDSKTISTMAVNDAIMTVNLSNYSSSGTVLFDFSYLNHDASLSVNDTVWIRGNDSSPWLPLYALALNQAAPGEYKNVYGLNLTSFLQNAGQALSSSTQIRFGQSGNGQIVSRNALQGYTFDDIVLHLVSTDAALTQIVSPSRKACESGSNALITIRIDNNSQISLSGVKAWYRINNNAAQGPFSIGTIPANGNLQFSFPPVDFSAYTDYTLSVWINEPSDTYLLNDTIKNYKFHNSPLINTFPHLQTFETDDGGWYAYGQNSSWAWGTPGKTKINKAANGTKAWTTGLTGPYNNLETSYLESPCYDLSGLASDPMISFSMAHEIETNYDKAWLEVTGDGVTWIKLGSLNSGVNWYNKQSYWDNALSYYHVASHTIPRSLLGSATSVSFRFVLVTDQGLVLEGLAIDDIHIFEPKSIYTGNNQTVTVSPLVSGWTDVYSGQNMIASLRPNNSQSLGNTDVAVYFNPSNDQRHDLNQYYLDRNFTIVPTNPLSSGTVTVRLYFTDEEVNKSRNAPSGYDKPTDAYELGVTQISSNSDDGIYGNESNPSVKYFSCLNTQTTPFNTGYYIEFDVTGFSEFYLNPGGINNNQPLPLKILSFEASALTEQRAVKLSYRLVDGVNIRSVDIERSTDGRFSNASIIASSVYTEDLKIFIDNVPPAVENVYYRLKITDRNGAVSYSFVRTVHLPDELSVQVSPNPTRNTPVKVLVSGSRFGQSASVELSDINGQTCRAFRFVPNGDPLFMNTEGLTSGVYILTVKVGEGLKQVKVVVL